MASPPARRSITSPPRFDEVDLSRFFEGASEPVCGLRARIRAAAGSAARLLLVTGEPGTGKERVAHAIFACMPQREHSNLEVLDCRVMVGEHATIDLLGSVLGAFPGAVDRPGAFERAGAGVVLLDEITAMPPAGQNALLRLIETGEVRRLGAWRAWRGDVRIVCTSSVDFAEEAAAGRLREALYYRLCQAPRIHVPSLRGRAADVPLLATSFLASRGAPGRLLPEALAALCDHSWPGNLRQLEAVLLAALRTAGERAITAEIVAGALEAIPAPAARGPRGEPSAERGFQSATDAVRRRMLREALDAACGNQTRAGILLGMHMRSDQEAPKILDLRDRKLAHRKFRYWWDRLCVGVEAPSNGLPRACPDGITPSGSA